MKTTFLSLVLIFFICVSYSQTVILDEEFKNNDLNWFEGETDTYIQKVKKGKYSLEHISESGAYYSWNICNFDESSDFEIETSIKKVSGVLNNGFGLVWGFKDMSNMYKFQISGDGHYRVDKVDNGTTTEIIKWTKANPIEQGNGETNILKIKRVGSEIQLYINGTYVDAVRYSKFYGNKIGFVINQNQKIQIDYIKVSN